MESDPGYQDRFIIPILYDKGLKRIVNNESNETIGVLYIEAGILFPDAHLLLSPFALFAWVIGLRKADGSPQGYPHRRLPTTLECGEPTESTHSQLL